MNISKPVLPILAGLACLTVACSNPSTETGAVPTSSRATTAHATATTTATPIVETVDNVSSAVNRPAPTGSIVVHVSDTEGARIGGTSVTASRVGNCDPGQYAIPAVDAFVERLEGQSDGNGNVVWPGATLGCWSVAVSAPTGFATVASSRAEVFLIDGGDTGEIDLFLRRGLLDPCAGEALAQAMGANAIGITYCDGAWAIVNAECGPSEGSCPNGHGDNARVLRRTGDEWVTYTALPSAMCLSGAKRDGVPSIMEPNFNPNC